MARLDTGWHAHPKILALGLQAMGLHAWSISYCDDALSDGFIPMGAWPALPGAGAAVKALLTAGLWTRADGGFWLHDYTDYNRTKAQVDAYMAAKIAAGRAGGLAKAASKRLADAKAGAVADAQADALANNLAKSKQDLYQKATPGPGPGVNSLVSQFVSPLSAVEPAGPVARGPARAHEAVPPEVAERLSRPPIAQRLTDQRTNGQTI